MVSALVCQSLRSVVQVPALAEMFGLFQPLASPVGSALNEYIGVGWGYRAKVWKSGNGFHSAAAVKNEVGNSSVL